MAERVARGRRGNQAYRHRGHVLRRTHSRKPELIVVQVKSYELACASASRRRPLYYSLFALSVCAGGGDSDEYEYLRFRLR
eukprot:scaffold485429_cov40-Prasinocladus_malaysianus.AAC.1